MPTINGGFKTDRNLVIQGPTTINGGLKVGENLIIYNGHIIVNGGVRVGKLVVVSDVRDFIANGSIDISEVTLERYTPMLPPGSNLQRLP